RHRRHGPGPRPRGPPARLREAGRAALHRPWHRRLARRPPLTSTRMGDLEIVERQLGRPPRAFRRVAVRCPYGAPAVVEQEPFDGAGEPARTQFWLTWRQLAASLPQW